MVNSGCSLGRQAEVPTRGPSGEATFASGVGHAEFDPETSFTAVHILQRRVPGCPRWGIGEEEAQGCVSRKGFPGGVMNGGQPLNGRKAAGGRGPAKPKPPRPGGGRKGKEFPERRHKSLERDSGKRRRDAALSISSPVPAIPASLALPRQFPVAASFRGLALAPTAGARSHRRPFEPGFGARGQDTRCRRRPLGQWRAATTSGGHGPMPARDKSRPSGQVAACRLGSGGGPGSTRRTSSPRGGESPPRVCAPRSALRGRGHTRGRAGGGDTGCCNLLTFIESAPCHTPPTQ